MLLSIIWLLAFAITSFTALHANIQMGIISSSRYCGERELAFRIKIAGENLGWTVFLDENEGRYLKLLNDLDFVICLLPLNKQFISYCPNYLTIFHPFNYLDSERGLLPFYTNYDGYLITIKDRKTIANSLALQNKEFHHISFYPTIHKIPYQKVSLNNLVTSIPLWSNRCTDIKFKTLYKMLSRTGFVKFYGHNKNRSIVQAGYIGKVPFDGVSVIDLLQQHGIVLVLHSDIHNENSIPSSRIFEAAAASTVIISDENPFVREHFGDSVFYIDTSLLAEEIFEQIQGHLHTIFQDPEKAWEMAKEAHEICMTNFEMSDQLLKLEALNRQVIARKMQKSEEFFEQIQGKNDPLFLDEGT